MPQPIPAVVVDPRERDPWPLSLPWTRAAVPIGGDYSLAGFERVICIERKSVDGLVDACTFDREPFARTLAGLRSRTYRALIVEAELADVCGGRYRSRAHPNSIVGSCAAITADGVPVLFAGNANVAAAYAERLLRKFHARALAAQETAA